MAEHAQITPQASKRKIVVAQLPLVWLPAVVATILLLVYAAQTGLGHWQIDEFNYFAEHRLNGWVAYFNRFYVSPRPFSELLIYAYGAVVLQFDRPFVGEVLVVLWAGVVAVMGGAAWFTLGRSPGRLAASVSLAIAPMLFVMQTNPVTEAFYWPIAAVAYLPAAAGATALLFLLNGDLTPVRQGWCCAALLLSAMSHEIGAAMAIGFAAAAGVYGIADHWAKRGTHEAARTAILWWLVPGVAGLVVMLALVVFRSGNVDLGSDAKPFTGKLALSAGAALRQMAIDAVSTGNSRYGAAAIAASVAEKLVFASGFGLIWLRFSRVRPGRWLAALAFGLLTAIFFSLLAAYYHYGDLCCERQATTRHWLIDLVYILAVVGILARWPAAYTAPGSPATWLGPCLLTASLMPVLLQAGFMEADFQVLKMARQSRARSWASGLAPGTGPMLFYVPPDNQNMLIHGTSEPIATYDLRKAPNAPSAAVPELITAIGRFFGKDTVTTCLAWQSEHSFLVDGVFVPACPPHDGPPDIVFNTGPKGS